MKIIRCVLVGDEAVGKTCMHICSRQDEFPKGDIPSVNSAYCAERDVDGRSVSVDVQDTSGRSEYDRLRPLLYPQTDVFIVCFSLVNPSSFESVTQRWVPELQHHRPEVPVILVGTKLDMRESPDNIKDQSSSHITTDQGRELMRQIQAEKYIECSALSQQTVKLVFEEAARAALLPKNTLGKRCHVI